MNIITLDFESEYSDEYTLSKMTTESYVRDPRFKALGLGVRFANGDKKWFDDPDEFLHHYREEPCQDAFLAHHSNFDGLILSHHYGIKPAFWLDTLSMARMLLGNHLPVGLDALARHFNLPAKSVPYNLFKGKHWGELTPEEQKLVADGCLHDVALTYRLFEMLLPDFPAEELRVVDMTVRMFTEPVLRGNVDLLAKVWMAENDKKNGMLDALGVDAADLQSAETFATLLRAEGVEPELKQGKNGDIYAFAKTDVFMKELAEDESRAGELARARLGVRSTIDQTRAERLGFMATRGELPVYLRYCGAHTTRWSGGDSLNWQNLRRGSDLRRAVEAPEGTALIVFDLSQIEARLLNELAGQWDVVALFRQGVDIYSIRATEFYGYPVSKELPKERGLGKQIELSCGYGAGADSIKATARRGSYGPAIVLDDAESLRARDVYRNTHPAVVAYWGTASRLIARIASDYQEEAQWGPMLIRGKRVYLPNGAPIIYDTLEYSTEWQSWRYRTRSGWKKLYGSALVAETTQALARVILSQGLLRIEKATGMRPVWLTHDDAVYVDKDVEKAEDHYQILRRIMETAPSWLPNLPLRVEGGVSTRYEK